MKQAYLRSLQMIKILNIKNRNEYNRYKKYYLVLNIDSLKYISGKRNFDDIIKIAKEVWKGFFFIYYSGNINFIKLPKWNKIHDI